MMKDRISSGSSLEKRMRLVFPVVVFSAMRKIGWYFSWGLGYPLYKVPSDVW